MNKVRYDISVIKNSQNYFLNRVYTSDRIRENKDILLLLEKNLRKYCVEKFEFDFEEELWKIKWRRTMDEIY